MWALAAHYLQMSRGGYIIGSHASFDMKADPFGIDKRNVAYSP
jgi:hypothetical protein